MPDYIIADTEEEYKLAAHLFREYAAWLKIDLSFQHFDDELQQLKTMYGKPEGGIVLCKAENEFIGCVGFRKIDKNTAELKRMFVKPSFQKMGKGKILLGNAIELAKALNYKTIRLDTLNYMSAAIDLYKKSGFYPIEAYYPNPNSGVLYFESKCRSIALVILLNHLLQAVASVSQHLPHALRNFFTSAHNKA